MTLHMRGTVHNQNKNNSSESETNTDWSKSQCFTYTRPKKICYLFIIFAFFDLSCAGIRKFLGEQTFFRQCQFYLYSTKNLIQRMDFRTKYFRDDTRLSAYEKGFDLKP